jgi:fumarate reductase flavoprotein subunit
MHWDVTTDVVVAGAGGAGLTVAAALSLNAPGVEVVLLEKDSRQPSNSAISHGLIAAAGTRYQLAAGILDDSPELMAQDIFRTNGHTSDPDLTFACCQNAAGLVHWLHDDIGVPIILASEIEWIGHSRPRMHAHPSRSGPPIVQALRSKVGQCENVVTADNTPLADLVLDANGRVLGVIAGPPGARQAISARKVVLTTGGFGANPNLLRQYIPEAEQLPYLGSQTSTGDGIQAGLAAGADICGMSGYEALGFATTLGTRISPGVVTAGGIVVNRDGVRFAREDVSHSEWGTVVARQPGGFGIAVWDESIHRAVETMSSMQESLAAGAIVRSENLVGLARAFNIDSGALAETLANYNDGVRLRIDSFGRDLLPRPLSPPFFGARIQCALAHTQGGLRIDQNGRVLKPSGSPIPNLYAAGGTAASLSGRSPSQYFGGSGLLSTYVLGWMVGRAIATHFGGFDDL